MEAIQNLNIQKMGTILQIIDDTEIVIESMHDPSKYISFDSVVCMEDHTPIGRVDDIFGSVDKPFYFVRLTVDQAILLKDRLSPKQDVYAVTVLSEFVEPDICYERFSSESEYEDSDDESMANTSTSKPTSKSPANRYGNSNRKYQSLRRQRASSVDRYGSALPNQPRGYGRNRGGYGRHRGRTDRNGNALPHYNRNREHGRNGYNGHTQSGYAQRGNTQTPPRMSGYGQNIGNQQTWTMNNSAAASWGGMGIPSSWSNLNNMSNMTNNMQSTFNPVQAAQYFRPQVNLIPSMNAYGTATNMMWSPQALLQQMQQQRITQSQSTTSQRQMTSMNTTNTQSAAMNTSSTTSVSTTVPKTSQKTGTVKVRSNPFSFGKK